MPQQPTNPQPNQPKKQTSPTPNENEKKFGREDDDSEQDQHSTKSMPDVDQPRKDDDQRDRN